MSQPINQRAIVDQQTDLRIKRLTDSMNLISPKNHAKGCNCLRNTVKHLQVVISENYPTSRAKSTNQTVLVVNK